MQIEISNYDLESNQDFLRIYEGADNSGLLLSQYTGINTSGISISTDTNQVFVEFISNSSNTRGGFELSYSVINDITALFSSSIQNIDQGQSISFTDLSSGDILNWQWYFESGTPATRTNQNPTVRYDDFGSFNVTLVVTDGVNKDSVTLEDFISVNESITCSGLIVFTDPSGVVEDGSGSRNYGNNMDCEFLIAPNDVDKVVLIVNNLSIQGGFDFVRIYDGSDEN